MKTISHFKAFFAVLCLSLVHLTADAQITSPKLDVNSINGDRIVAVAHFPSPVVGDLYLATEFAGHLWFITPGPTGINLFLDPVPYQANGSFSADMTVLDISSAGIAPGIYPLYQVVTLAGKNPLEFSNWIGGISSLSRLDFKINTNNVPTPSPLPPTVVPTPTASPIPSLPPAVTATPAPTATLLPTIHIPTGLITVLPTVIFPTATPTPSPAPTLIFPSGLITVLPTIHIVPTATVTPAPTFVVPSGLITLIPTIHVTLIPTIKPTIVVPTFHF